MVLQKLKHLMLLLIVVTMSSCYSSVGQTEEGFLYNSWTGEDKSGKIFKGGSHSHGWHDDMYKHSLETQSKTYQADVLSSNGLNVGVKLTINWVNNAGTVKDHNALYGLDGEHRFIDPTVYGTIKDVVGKFLPEEIYSTKREQIETEIQSQVNGKFEESKLFTLKLVEILDIDIPASIAAAIEQKVKEEQTTLKEEQKAKTKAAQGLSLVELAKAQSEAAGFEANRNRKISASITPQIIKMRELDLEERRIKKWNGAYPKVMGGDSGLLLDIGSN